eukprot:GEMP01048117.1.p2 GENE.GEMP01048117.1~~GEMP01048117.1.p2  ORF type:complete len:142 (+),score=3.39 GEMP01048117.1:208-633(+)
MSVCLHACIPVCVHTCMHVRTHVPMYVCMHISMYVCKYVCLCGVVLSAMHRRCACVVGGMVCVCSFSRNADSILGMFTKDMRTYEPGFVFCAIFWVQEHPLGCLVNRLARRRCCSLSVDILYRVLSPACVRRFFLGGQRPS